MTKIFDAHFHLFDPSFHLQPNQGCTPEFFTLDDYQNNTTSLNLIGGALVSSSFQGYDQTFLTHALAKLGKNFVGVTQLPPDISDQEILQLHELGVRAARFPIYRGASIDSLETFAKRIYDLAGWHVELYTDDVDQLKSLILKLPKVSIDHLGLTQACLNSLIQLVEQGVMVKASGFHRCSLNPWDAMKKLYHANPHSLMFGTDLPSTRCKPFSLEDLDRIRDSFSEKDLERILWKNGSDFYL